MKKILLLGGNGRVGRYIKSILEKSFEVTNPASWELDIKSIQLIQKYVDRLKPEVIINSVMAPVSVDDAEKDENKKLVFEINSDAAGNLAKIASQINAQYFYLSTAYVFDGRLDTSKSYQEEDVKNPISVYGKSKSEGENSSLMNCSKTTVVRIEMPYSASFDGPEDILKTFYKMLLEGQTINAMDDQFCTPTFIPDVAQAIKNLIDSKSLGVWHVAGDRTSPFKMASKIAEIGGFSVTQVLPVKFDDYKRPAPRPQNSCLNSSKYQNKFGVRMHSIDYGIKLFFQNINEQKKN